MYRVQLNSVLETESARRAASSSRNRNQLKPPRTHSETRRPRLIWGRFGPIVLFFCFLSLPPLRAGTTARGALTPNSCSRRPMSGSAADVCTVALSSAPGRSGLNVSLLTSNAVAGQAAGMDPRNFTNVNSKATASSLVIKPAANSATSAAKIFKRFVQMNAGVSTASALSSVTCSSSSVAAPGTVSCSVNMTGLSPAGGLEIQVTSSNPGVSTPTWVVVPAGASSAPFSAAVASGASGTVTLQGTFNGVSKSVALQVGSVLSSVSCSSGSLTGSGTDACSLTLSTGAASGGLNVSLSSNNSAVTVPASVIVPANCASVGFIATVSSVAIGQTVTLTATSGSVSRSFTLRLQAAVPTLRMSAASVLFGNVQVNTSSTQSVILTSTGTAAVTVNDVTLAGAGFTLLSASLPVTLSPGRTLTLNVQFNPAAIGAATGQLTVTSNSTTNGTAVISLSGTGTAPPATLSMLSCSSGTITGAGTDECTVALTAAAPSAGLTVNLSTSNSVVKVPSTMTVPAGAASAGFTASVSSVPTAQAVTITASVGRMFTSYTLQLNATILALSINPISVAFGKVVVNTPATQSITFASTGTAPVTINGITLTGTGFAMLGPALPVTLAPNQATTVDISFDLPTASAATGQLTVLSNASTNSTAVVGLTGTSVAAVALTPASAATTVGTTLQFEASVTGTSNTAVTWAVSGTRCSGTACGTITSNGLYTAPAAVPSPATVTITATSVSNPTQSASSTVTVVPTIGAKYYLAPAGAGGNDSNNGLSPQTPWLTPNHYLNCGDVIIAAASTAYSAANFQSNKWGTVTCPANNNVAWLQCAAFDACKIAASNVFAMWMSKSYWGVQGWEVSGTGNGGVCIGVTPVSGTTIHHIILANNYCTGGANGFATSPQSTTASVDYIAIIGNISRDASRSTALCNSGITIYEPVKFDSLPGTHIYIAGNFTFDTNSQFHCASRTLTYDGNGIALDDIGSAQSGGTAYNQQIVVQNNLSVFNGGYGLGNTGSGSPSSPIYWLYNTSANNVLATNLDNTTCGDFTSLQSSLTTVTRNIVKTSSATGCHGLAALYAVALNDSDATDTVASNWLYSAAGNNIGLYSNTGFVAGSNTTGIDPSFVNPVDPGTPDCTGKANTVNCMSTVVANFTPTNAAAQGYGYQAPSGTPVYDPLYPQWLCSVSNLPSGLVTPGCA
jgi:Abnormal spindle-like microcephaly-assoc'd, ASPM-SPD-2-Hydin